MAETQTQAEKPAAAEQTPKSGKKKVIWILLAVVSIVAGAALPVVLGAGSFGKSAEEAPKKKKAESAEPTIIAFGDVAVNLAESRMTRYLRVKIVIQVDSEAAKDLTKELEKRKPVMKDWLISHLSGKSLKDVAGTVGVKRCQREIQERFEEFLFPHGEGIEFEVLFEEFVVQ